MLLFGFSAVDSESVVPYVIIAISGAWLGLFAVANRKAIR